VRDEMVQVDMRVAKIVRRDPRRARRFARFGDELAVGVATEDALVRWRSDRFENFSSALGETNP
jgi:hypothetical protein